MPSHRTLATRLARTVGALVACAVLLRPAHAHAEGKVAADLEANYPTKLDGVQRGWGAGLRVGDNWDLWLVELTPELGGSYHSFSGVANARAYRAVIGARLAVGFVLEPSAFAHAGVGHFSYTTDSADVSHTGLGYDAGIGLDFTLIPKIDIGAHAALAGVSGNQQIEPLSWLVLGVHLAISTGDD